MILVKKKKKFFKKRKFSKTLKKYKSVIISFILITLSLLTSFFFIKKFLFSKDNQIHYIIFTDNTIKTYNNPLLYKKIIENLSWKNIYISKLFYLKKIQNLLKKDFPIIKKLNLSWKKENKTAIIDIEYLKPQLIFFNQKEYLGYLSWKRFLINKTSPWIKNSLIINLPKYTAKYNIRLTGFFFKISPKKLEKDFENIKKKLKLLSIVYYPWWLISKLTTTSWIIIYINHEKDINKQLEKFFILKQNFTWFNKFQYIDIWSQDNIIFWKVK